MAFNILILTCKYVELFQHFASIWILPQVFDITGEEQRCIVLIVKLDLFILLKEANPVPLRVELHHYMPSATPLSLVWCLSKRRGLLRGGPCRASLSQHLDLGIKVFEEVCRMACRHVNLHSWIVSS